jgi:hypothetical protein
MFDLFITSDIARKRVRDQFEARPTASSKAGGTRTGQHVPRTASTRPRRLLASLRAVSAR